MLAHWCRKRDASEKDVKVRSKEGDSQDEVSAVVDGSFNQYVDAAV